MSNIDKLATELLIENGVLVADTLRHLADNEIDSDYFAICHSNENGTEIECELAITDYARQAAGTVDELVKALEAAENRIAELETDCWTYENTVKNLLERVGSAESACFEAARILKSGERMALTRAVNILLAAGEGATHYQYPVLLPEPLGWKSPSGNEVLKKKDVIAALMSAGVRVEGGD